MKLNFISRKQLLISVGIMLVGGIAIFCLLFKIDKIEYNYLRDVIWTSNGQILYVKRSVVDNTIKIMRININSYH